jgi:hypothetical protein
MDDSLIYDRKTKYISSFCPYLKKTINATRPTAICWPTNINKIIELSRINKTTQLNLSECIQVKSTSIHKKKHSHREIIEEKKESVLPFMSLSHLISILPERIRPISTNNTTDHFWNIIRRVVWYDKDERLLTRDNIKIYIIKRDIRYVLECMDNVFIPELKIAVSDGPLLQAIEPENHNNILAHIIIKGLEFYNGIRNNPDVSLYLCDQYYPVYDWLRSCI